MSPDYFAMGCASRTHHEGHEVAKPREVVAIRELGPSLRLCAGIDRIDLFKNTILKFRVEDEHQGTEEHGVRSGIIPSDKENEDVALDFLVSQRGATNHLCFFAILGSEICPHHCSEEGFPLFLAAVFTIIQELCALLGQQFADVLLYLVRRRVGDRPGRPPQQLSRHQHDGAKVNDNLCQRADERVLVALGNVVRLVPLTPIGLPAKANERHGVHGQGVNTIFVAVLRAPCRSHHVDLPRCLVPYQPRHRFGCQWGQGDTQVKLPEISFHRDDIWPIGLKDLWGKEEKKSDEAKSIIRHAGVSLTHLVCGFDKRLPPRH